MSQNADTQLARQREALISLTAMYYIEEHALLDAAQLADAKESLKALFLRTSGAETTLRRLIEVLKVRRNMQTAFSGIAATLNAVRRSIETMGERIDNLRRLIERSPVSAEAHAVFIGPFLSFSIRFTRKLADFDKALQKYLSAREHEARAQAVFRIAQDSRERLRQRLAGELTDAAGTPASGIKKEIDTSVNYVEAEAALQAAVKLAQAAEAAVGAELREIHLMCQTTVAPAKRERGIAVKPAEDLYTNFAGLQQRDAGVAAFKDRVSELIMLYQRAYSMFSLDFERLKQALGRLEKSSDDYFQAKADDKDMAAKREKLKKIEVLIQFLERAAQLTAEAGLDTLPKFSKALSDVISEPYASWKLASEELLPAKVRAEAEMARVM